MKNAKKRCIECGMEKPVSEFYAAIRNHDGLNNKCKKCVLAYGREYKAHRRAEAKGKRPPKKRPLRGPRDTVKTFGPAYEFWNELLLKRKGKRNASV